jgi:hypothetical protein
VECLDPSQVVLQAVRGVDDFFSDAANVVEVVPVGTSAAVAEEEAAAAAVVAQVVWWHLCMWWFDVAALAAARGSLRSHFPCCCGKRRGGEVCQTSCSSSRNVSAITSALMAKIFVGCDWIPHIVARTVSNACLSAVATC